MQASTAPMTFERLRARLGIATKKLADSEDDPASFRAVSRVQAKAVLDGLATADMNVEKREIILEMVMAVKWHADDRNAVINACSGDLWKPTLTESNCRAKGQNYTNFINFVPVWFIEFARSEGVSAEVVLEKANEMIIKLGCKYPSEYTFKMLNSFWLKLTESKASLDGMTSMEKWQLKEHVKEKFRQQIKGAPDPLSWCSELHAEPAKFRLAHPKLFEQAFGAESCVGSRELDTNAIVAFDSTYRCRKPPLTEAAASTDLATLRRSRSEERRKAGSRNVSSDAWKHSWIKRLVVLVGLN